MVHSGSRGIGPTIRDHHLNRGQCVGAGFRALAASSDQGIMYLRDAAWAKRFADASRRAMATEAGTVMETILGARLCWDTAITTDHNHVSLEHHRGRELWVHRKGAMPAALGQAGVLPGSMGSSSFHVEARARSGAVLECARRRSGVEPDCRAGQNHGREFRRQMEGVSYDYRLSEKLRDEAPAAYKDIKTVLAHSGIWSR